LSHSRLQIKRRADVTRVSGDELRDGFVWNGFDYALQVWVIDGIVQRCGHPPVMARRGPCCTAFVLAGHRIAETPGAQRRGSATGPTAAPGVTEPLARPSEA
jgi:hypothetical protein